MKSEDGGQKTKLWDEGRGQRTDDSGARQSLDVRVGGPVEGSRVQGKLAECVYEK